MLGALTAISIPMLVFNFSGNRVELEQGYFKNGKSADVDWLLAISTVGNLGTDRLTASDRAKCFVEPANASFVKDERCAMGYVTVANTKIPMTTVAYVFEACDLVIVLIYIMYWLYFSQRVKRIRADADRRHLTVSHYAVRVDGIPPETQREDVRGRSDPFPFTHSCRPSQSPLITFAYLHTQPTSSACTD